MALGGADPPVPVGISCRQVRCGSGSLRFARVKFSTGIDAVEPSAPLVVGGLCHLLGTGDQAVGETAVLLHGPDPATGVDLEAFQDGEDVIGDLASLALADLAAGPVDELEVGGLGETLQG
jgi:hypothetical protein